MADLNKIVIPNIETKWKNVTFTLRFKMPTVNAIKAKYNGDPKNCCQELLIEWLCTYGIHPKTTREVTYICKYTIGPNSVILHV